MTFANDAYLVALPQLFSFKMRRYKSCLQYYQTEFYSRTNMKYKLLALIIFVGQISFGQTDINTIIDTSNYYNYFSNGKNLKGQGPTTSWLTLNEVVPVIMDELEKAGHDWLYDYSLFKVATGQDIVLAAYSRKSNFGFLYIQGHEIFPSKDHRKHLTQNDLLGADYSSCEETPSGEPNFIKIKKLPKNVFVLNENCYWYQYTDNIEDNKSLVTRETAFKILRQDVKKYLKKVKVVK
jgi:hypothetical protein